MNHIDMMRSAWLNPNKIFNAIDTKTPMLVRMHEHDGFECLLDPDFVDELENWLPLTPSLIKIENYTWEEYHIPNKKLSVVDRIKKASDRVFKGHSVDALIEIYEAILDGVGERFGLEKKK